MKGSFRHFENNKKDFIAGRSLNRAIEAANEVGYRVEGIEKSFKNLENLTIFPNS